MDQRANIHHQDQPAIFSGLDHLCQSFQRVMHRLLERHIDSAEHLALQHAIHVLRLTCGGRRTVGNQNHPAVRTGVNPLAVMATLFEEQAQPDHLRRRTLNMQQFIDFSA